MHTGKRLFKWQQWQTERRVAGKRKEEEGRYTYKSDCKPRWRYYRINIVNPGREIKFLKPKKVSNAPVVPCNNWARLDADAERD